MSSIWSDYISKIWSEPLTASQHDQLEERVLNLELRIDSTSFFPSKHLPIFLSSAQFSRSLTSCPFQMSSQSFNAKTTAEQAAQAFKDQIQGENGESQSATWRSPLLSDWPLLRRLRFPFISVLITGCSPGGLGEETARVRRPSTLSTTVRRWPVSRLPLLQSGSRCQWSWAFSLHRTRSVKSRASLQDNPFRNSFCQPPFPLFGHLISRVRQGSCPESLGVLWIFGRPHR